MRVAIGLMVLLAACGDDDGGDDALVIDGGHDAGNLDASRDAGDVDGGKSDAGDGGPLTCSPLDRAYRFYLDGGLSPLRDRYTVSGGGEVVFERLPGLAYMDAGTFACTGSLGACGTAALDVGDITGALRDVSGLWDDGSAVYGEDARYYDGQVLIVERTSDGKQIIVGPACTGSTSCTEIPASVAQLKTIFDRLRTEIALGQQTDGGLPGSCAR